MKKPITTGDNLRYSYLRWLKVFKISLGSERKQRIHAKGLLGDNLTTEEAVFSFPLKSGGEELRAAPFVYVPDLVEKVTNILTENKRYGFNFTCMCQCLLAPLLPCRANRLTWHKGAIPADEVWLKLGGDKGHGSVKMNFQWVNTETPNSKHNTCVFGFFKAGDSPTNLQVALGQYKEQVTRLQEMQIRWGL